ILLIFYPLNLFLGKRPDIFFTPTHYAPRFSRVPTAISIMDLSFIHFPNLFVKKDLYQLVNWTRYSVKNASKIFTISESSKSDIIDVYGVGKDKIHVTYPGIKEAVNVRILTMDDLRKKFGIDKNYILFVGTLQPRKNIVKLIEAFSKIERENLILVIVGKKGWLYEDILSAPQKFNVSDRVKFLDFVQDQDLPSLYKNALCFVLPSLYEGFGLPILEAMKYGCPVLTSNVSSLPEAGGEAAIYFDPQDANDIKEKIEKVINSPKLRDEMIEKGKQQVKKFSWEKTARQTLQVLEDLGK
ncbi:MAG: glycosyltransferase family 4 protein, partial [Candidatus Levybacteria bacterium]|nr:glycosyltransferase family 4 protein [Candidatus Levybacteria bacterium]